MLNINSHSQFQVFQSIIHFQVFHKTIQVNEPASLTTCYRVQYYQSSEQFL